MGVRHTARDEYLKLKREEAEREKAEKEHKELIDTVKMLKDREDARIKAEEELKNKAKKKEKDLKIPGPFWWPKK
jgi:hypothetical protein